MYSPYPYEVVRDWIGKKQVRCIVKQCLAFRRMQKYHCECCKAISDMVWKEGEFAKFFNLVPQLTMPIINEEILE